MPSETNAVTYRVIVNPDNHRYINWSAPEGAELTMEQAKTMALIDIANAIHFGLDDVKEALSGVGSP